MYKSKEEVQKDIVIKEELAEQIKLAWHEIRGQINLLKDILAKWDKEINQK